MRRRFSRACSCRRLESYRLLTGSPIRYILTVLKTARLYWSDHATTHDVVLGLDAAAADRGRTGHEERGRRTPHRTVVESRPGEPFRRLAADPHRLGRRERRLPPRGRAVLQLPRIP